MNDSSPAAWIAWLLVALAIIALILLVRGTSDHSRYQDAFLPVAILTVA